MKDNMHKNNHRGSKICRLMLIGLLALLPVHTFAQCGIKNTAFGNGEFVSYDLYFNWKFVWFKVGTASMSTVTSNYKGQDAYRSSLTTRGNQQLDNMFVMRDTLLCYTDMNVAPLYFRKGAREGKRYYVDEIWYTYPNNNCHVKMHEITSSGDHKWKEAEYKNCLYDMMSIYLRARNFNADELTEGEKIPLPIADGLKVANAWLKYGGKTTLKMKNSSNKYRCLVFSFIQREDNKNHELIRFYVTDDENHLPVRLDMFLSFGTAKAYLTGYKGLRNPMTSKVGK
jgi:hypothetical protein